ncbi:uncharacterized protein G2W53_037924 [Senna tora]|uniref:Uncharacterized protein n=1 Tax=Senna tora TaxID=362788 RepID=A0A834SK73_9FABA|nr:uncharacterized protein G2W53_037924 [Senna tora]
MGNRKLTLSFPELTEKHLEGKR